MVAAIMLCGCDPAAYARYRQQAAAERDLVPPLYRAPLTVHYLDGRTPEAVYTMNGTRRIDWTYTSGAAHSILDARRQKILSWKNFGRDGGKLQIQPTSPDLDILLRRWDGRTTAERLGACSYAEETGHWYRYMRPLNFKGAGGDYVQACITTDGVVLAQATYRANLKPQDVYKRAVDVSRAPLPPDIFTRPGDEALLAQIR